MEELETSFFENLYVAKRLWDLGYADRFLTNCGTLTVDDLAYFELTWEAIFSVFPESCDYYNGKAEIDALVCFDPLIDEFCRLCLEYEKRAGFPLGGSEFRAQVEKDIYESLNIEYGYYNYGYGYDYDYSFCFYHDQHGRGRLVFLMGSEFTSFCQIPAALAAAKSTLRSHVLALRKALDPELGAVDRMIEKKEVA